MPTLHSVTDEIRTILKWGGLIVVAILISIFLFRFGKNAKEYFYPTPPSPPTVIFGKLPSIAFPNSISNEDFSYTVDTVSGFLPIFTDRAFVYEMIKDVPNLLNLERARAKVSEVGFENTSYTAVVEKAQDNTTYQWTLKDIGGKSITMNIITNNFTLISPYLTNPAVVTPSIMPNEEQAIGTAETFLSQMELTPTDIDKEKYTTQLLSISNGILIPATSFSKTQLIRVNMFQSPLNSLPIYYNNPLRANISFLIAGTEYAGEVVQANYFHQKISQTSATYPIKTTDQAFAELKEGKAYIASYEGTTKDIQIKDMFLAYYMPANTIEYIEPIFVFTGNDKFYAYLPAITSQWVR